MLIKMHNFRRKLMNCIRTRVRREEIFCYHLVTTNIRIFMKQLVCSKAGKGNFFHLENYSHDVLREARQEKRKANRPGPWYNTLCNSSLIIFFK